MLTWAARFAARFAAEIEREQLRLVISKKPILELVRDYRAELVRQGCSRIHVHTSGRYVERTLFRPPIALEALTPEVIAERLSREFQGRASSHDHALVTLRAFLEFAGFPDDRNPARRVERPRVTPGLPYASLPAEAVDRLCDHPEIDFARGTCYMLAAANGPRRGALQGLAVADLDLDRRLVRLPAGTAKNRKWSWHPLAERVADRLREHLARRARDEGAMPVKVFASVPGPRTFRRDLGRVGIALSNVEGKVVMHSLRVTTATRCAEHNIAPKVAQALLDHAKVETTLRSYTRMPSAAERDAVERIAPGRKVV
jgi:integrase